MHRLPQNEELKESTKLISEAQLSFTSSLDGQHRVSEELWIMPSIRDDVGLPAPIPNIPWNPSRGPPKAP